MFRYENGEAVPADLLEYAPDGPLAIRVVAEISAGEGKEVEEGEDSPPASTDTAPSRSRSVAAVTRDTAIVNALVLRTTVRCEVELQAPDGAWYPVVVLVDTGAEITVISRRFLPPGTPELATPVSLGGAFQGKDSTCTKCVVPVRRDGIEYGPAYAFVSDLLTAHQAVFGLDWLRANRMKWSADPDPCKESLTFQGRAPTGEVGEYAWTYEATRTVGPSVHLVRTELVSPRPAPLQRRFCLTPVSKPAVPKGGRFKAEADDRPISASPSRLLEPFRDGARVAPPATETEMTAASLSIAGPALSPSSTPAPELASPSAGVPTDGARVSTPTRPPVASPSAGRSIN